MKYVVPAHLAKLGKAELQRKAKIWRSMAKEAISSANKLKWQKFAESYELAAKHTK